LSPSTHLFAVSLPRCPSQSHNLPPWSIIFFSPTLCPSELYDPRPLITRQKSSDTDQQGNKEPPQRKGEKKKPPAHTHIYARIVATNSIAQYP
jgi:hypothetical protein